MRLRVFTPILAAFALSCDPTAPKDPPLLAVVAGDGFSCALAGESAYCWGRNDLGQLGRGAVGENSGPGPVTGEHRFKLLAASERTACGVTTDDQVYCWGHFRIFGGSTPVAMPTLIPGTFPDSITSIGLGWAHGCVLATGGAVTCFGTNGIGELGNGTTGTSTGALGATAVTGGHSFSLLAVGVFHACGLESGDVWCWGTNHFSAFGPGKNESQAYPTPTQITLAFDATRIDAGSAVTCVLDAAVKAWCWGVNVSGQLGRGAGSAGASSAVPTEVSQTSNYVSVAMPRLNSIISHSCGITPGGTAFCWGLADSSQLGRTGTETCTSGASTLSCSAAPAAIGSALSFKQLALGRDHTCGLTKAEPAEVYCWGANARQQLGSVGGGPTTTAVRVTIP